MSQQTQSYQAFLQENLTDRASQRAYFDQVRGTDTRFKGLDEATQANILADVSGFEPFRRFAQGNISQGLDAFGNFIQQAATEYSPADVINGPIAIGQLLTGGRDVPRWSDALEKPFSAHAGDAGYAASKGLGASESTAQAFRMGAEQIPNVVTQLGMTVGATALAPFTAGASLIGLPAMYASMYGQGLDQAYSQGEFGVKSHVAASVGPLASALTMGLARPIGGWAANKVMSVGTSKAIRDGMALGGEVGLKSVLASEAVNAGVKIAMKVGQEALVESAQAGIGIVADISQNAILDPTKFFTETIMDKNYWIPMLMSEVIEGAGGTVLGRMRKPLDAGEGRQVVTEEEVRIVAEVSQAAEGETPVIGEEPKETPGLNLGERRFASSDVAARLREKAIEEAQLELPLFSEPAKLAADIADPTAADSDNALITSEKETQQIASGLVLNEVVNAKASTLNPEFNPALPEGVDNVKIIPATESSYVHSPTHVIDHVGRGLAAKGGLELNDNPAESSMRTIAHAIDLAPEGVEPHQAIANVMETSLQIGGKEFKQHEFDTDPGNRIKLLNPGTAQYGVQVHFLEGKSVANFGSAAAQSKFILSVNDMLTLDPATSRAEYDAKRTKMSRAMSETEWGLLVELSNRTKNQEANVPVGVSFAEGHDPTYAKEMTDYLFRSGIQEALVRAGVKLRFGMEARKITKDTLQNSPLDYFASMNRASNNRIGNIHYISRNEGFGTDTDPHELGHTVGDLIRNGHFGADVAVQFNAFLDAARVLRDDGRVGSRGAKLNNQISGRPTDDTNVELTRQYLLGNPNDKGVVQDDVFDEIAAQTFQGYFAGKSNPVSKWVKKTFPLLHDLFTKLMNTLKVTGDKDKTALKLNLYSPEYQQGRAILENILNTRYTESENVAKKLRSLVGKYKLTGKAVEATTSAWYSSTKPQAHENITSAIKIWSQGHIEPGKPLGSEIDDLVDSLTQLVHFNKVNIRGHLPAGEALLGMPWMRKLAGGNLEKIHLSIQGKIEDPKLLSVLNKVFLTKAEQDFIRNNSTNITDPQALKRASVLVRNRELLLLNIQNVTKAIDELLAANGEHRVKGNQVVKQMFQLDNVVKKWMLGKLEGQNGVPFFDQNNNIFATELTPKTMADVGKSHTFYKWFPILAKAIRKGVTRTKETTESYVANDGSVAFGDEKLGNIKRLTFTDLVEADNYAQTRNMEADIKVRYKVKKSDYKGTTKYHILAEEVKQDSRYIDEMQTDADWEQDMQELIKPAPTVDGDIDYLTPEEITMRAEDALDSARKNAFVKEHGPAVSRKLKDIVPSAIKFYDAQGLLNEGITAQQNKFDVWLKKAPKNRMLLGKLAESLNIPKNSDAITVATTWIRLHLDEKKPQQKAQSIQHLNWISPKLDGLDSNINDYIMSMHNFAKAYSKAVEGKASSQMLSPKVRGHVPEVTPSEFGGHARLANTDIMNDRDVTSGTAAAIVGQPGGFQGRKTAPEQINHILKNIIGKPLGVAQDLQLLIGAGPIHTALANPSAKPLADAICREVVDATAWVAAAAEDMFNKGTMAQDVNGEWMFVKNEKPERDDNSAVYKIGHNLKLKEEHQLINWLEQEASMPFERLLNMSNHSMLDENGKEVDATPLILRAKAIAESLTPETLAIHREALARRYAAQRTKVRREVESDQFGQIASFALSVATNEYFRGSSTKALDFSGRYAMLPTEQKVLSLVNELNLTPEDAMDTTERYELVTDRLMKKHQFMHEHLEYITETRMKDYHVGLVYAKQKDGTILSPGYFDFDSLPEANAFVAEQLAKGNKPGKIKDFARQRWNYKPLSGSLNEIIERVTAQKRELVGTILYKQLSEEDQNLVERILSGTAQDIQTENDVVLASKNDLVKRKFVGGRENLDMLDQFSKSTQRRAAAMSRKRTDVIFKLFEQDEELVQEEGLFQIMDHFRKGARMKDTEFQKNVGKAGFMMYIMGNVSSALIEIFQFPITLSPILLENGASIFDAYRIPAKMMKIATKAALSRLRQKSNKDIWEGEWAEVLEEAERQGRGNQMKNHDFDFSKADDLSARYDAMSDEIGVKKGALHIAGLTYKFFNDLYSFFNKINADLSIVTSYEVLKKTQYGNKPLNEIQKKTLQNEAMMMADVANGSLQRLGRPAFMHSERQGVRNAGSMYWSLQSFVNAQVANQLRFMQKSVNMGDKFTKTESVRARKAMVGLLGAQFTGMGIMGFTLMPAMAKLVQEAFGFDLEDELRELLYDDSGKTVGEKTFMGEVAMNGFLSAIGSPVDVGTRISVGGIGPLTAFNGVDANQLGGPLIGLAFNAFKDLDKVKAGNMSLGEGALNLLPMGLRKGVRMSFFDDGSVYDSQKRFMFQASGAEQFGAWMGFSTLRAKKEMKYRMEKDEAMKQDISEKSSLANAIIRSQAENPFRVQALLNQGAQQFHMKQYDFAAYVADKQVDKQKGPDPREGAGPESVLAKRLYPSPLGNQGQEDRLHAKYAALRGLGVAPKISRTAVNNARQEDYWLRLDPTMSSGTASRRRTEDPRMRQGFSSLLGDE